MVFEYEAQATPSRTFMGSTILPPMAISDDDVVEYRGIADESVRETRALYEDFLYRRNRSMDSRRWKHIRNKDTLQVYRQRSCSSDSGVTGSGSGMFSGASVSSTSSPDSLEDDALLIGPGSSLSIGTKIPVVIVTGTVQGTLEDVMYGLFAHDSPSLRRRSIYIRDGMEDLVMLGTIESPTERKPFEFLGVAWYLYSVMGLGAIVKQRDYVVLVSTGFTTTSRGERVGYSIAQSVPHPDMPELDHIVRASMSYCSLYRQHGDGVVESFLQAVVEPGGSVPSVFVMKQFLASIVGMGAAVECAESKKLRHYMHKRNADKAALASSSEFAMSSSSSSSFGSASQGFQRERASVCSYCHKSIGKVFSAQSMECTICHETVCKRCCVTKTIAVRSRHTTSGMVGHPYDFCLGCFLAARDSSPAELQREEVVRKRILR